MGKTNSTLVVGEFELYAELEDPRYGEMQIYKHKDNHNMLKLKKSYNSNFFGISIPEITYLAKRVQSLPEGVLQCEVQSHFALNPTIYSQKDSVMEVLYDSRTLSLRSIVSIYGKSYPETAGINLLYFIGVNGAKLEERLDYFPKLDLDCIFIDEEGLKLENPYLHEHYIKEIVDVSPDFWKKFKHWFLTF